MSFTFKHFGGVDNHIVSVPADKYWVDKYGIYFTDNNGKLIRQFDIDEIDINTIEHDNGEA